MKLAPVNVRTVQGRIREIVEIVLLTRVYREEGIPNGLKLQL